MFEHAKNTMKTAILAGTVALGAIALLPSSAFPASTCGGVTSGQGGDIVASKNETKTIVTTAQSAGSFGTLVSLVQAADLAGALSGDGKLTVFAPTDEAFAQVPLPVLNALANDKKLLARVLTYHVAAGELGSADVLALPEVTTLEGNKARVALVDGKPTIGGATIIKTDIDAGNGVIHVIDRVILPPDVAKVAAGILANTPDIVTTAVEAGQFTTLAALLTKAGLVETLQGAGPFTVFAPTDEAFAKVPQATLDALAANPDALKAVLLYHVVPGQVTAASVLKQKSVKTVEGSSATIGTLNGGAQIQNANIIKTDIATRNGVIHVIDSVILPPADRLGLAQ